MSRKRKPYPELHNLEITAIAAEGNALGRHDDMVVFVPFAAPGDVVDVQVVKKRKSYAEARLLRVVKPSEMRLAPKCEHFTVCGGCRWQHLPYDYQLKCKRQQVVDVLDRIAKVEHPEVPEALGSEKIYAYRNKLEYTFSNRRWLTFEELETLPEGIDRSGAGFHLPGCFDKVLDIEKCWLQDDFSNQLRNFTKQFAIDNGLSFYDIRERQGMLRNLTVRIASTGEIMALFAFGDENAENHKLLLDAVMQHFPQITSLMYVVNLKVNDTVGDLDIMLHSGKPYIEERMEDLVFRIGPKSFYQTNSEQAYRLYDTVRRFARLTGKETVYDLYTGTGTIANFIARNVSKVIGIEYVPEAIEDAKINADVNGLENIYFFAGDMKDVLNEGFIATHGKPDVIITDPPRAGMHQSVVDVILKALPESIVYVSCNPATQARDLALLDSHYEITDIQPVDMFPHTAHIENVVRLGRRETPKI